MSVNVGEVSGVIKLADEFTKPLLAAAQGLVDFQSNLDKASKRLSAFGDGGEKSTRKVKDETAKLQKEYQRLAMQLDPVYAKTVKYERAQTTLNNALKAGIITQAQYNQRLTQLQGPLQQAEHWTTRLGRSVSGELTSSFTRWFAISAAIGGATAIINKVFTDLVQATTESEQSQVKLQVAFDRTSNASGLTARGASNLADELSRLSGIDDELIADALAVESRFNRLSGEVFKRVAEAALDMSAATGVAVPAAMEKAASYVNLPLKALTKLGREGYAVSASQSDMVKNFLRTNDVAGAQGVILDILESRYKGTAAEVRDTLGGAFTAMGTAWENLLEKMGQDNTGPIRDVIETIITLLKQLTSQIDNTSLGWNQFIATLIQGDIQIQKLRGFFGADDASERIAQLEEELGRRTQSILENLAKQGKIPKQIADMMGLLGEESKRAESGVMSLTDAERKLNEEISKQAAILRSASEAIINYHERLGDTLDGLSRSLSDQMKLAEALKHGEVQYNLTSRAMERSNAVETATLNLTKAHRAEIDKLNKARLEMLVAGNKIGAAKIASEIQRETAAFERQRDIVRDVTGEIVDLKQRNEDNLRVIRESREWTDQYNTALAELTDAFTGNTSATLENAIAIEIKSQKLLNNITAEGDAADAIAETTAKRLKAIDTINRQADAMRAITSIRQEAEFRIEIGKIDQSLSSDIINVETQFLSLLRDMGEGSISEGRRVFDELSGQFGVTVEEIKNYLKIIQDADFVAQVRDDLKTPRDRIREYITLVERSSSHVIEKERAIAAARSQLLDIALDDWGTFFDFLGGMFGGFAQQIANSLRAIQSAYQQGQKLDASGFGGSMAGAFGGLFATAAIFHEVYKLVSADIKRERARTFSEITSISVTGGEWSSPSFISQAGRELEAALRDLVRQISDSLGGILKELPKITIRARKDGKEFSAYVAGLWVGTFRDAQSALEQGVASAIQQADFEGVSQEFVQALQRSIGATLDELEANIETARTARRARIGEVGEQYVDISDQWRQEIRAMQDLGLAIDDAVAARDRELAALKNNVLGIDTAVSDQLRALGSLSAGIAESADDTRAVLQQQIDNALNQIARLQSRGPGAGAGTGIGAGGPGGNQGIDNGGDGDGIEEFTKDQRSDWEESIRLLQESVERWRDEIDKVPQALSDQEINMGIFDALYKYLEGSGKYAEQAHKYALMKVEIEFAAIKAQLIALGKWEEFAVMFNDAYNAARQEAGKPRGRGAGGGQRQEVRDFIKDKEFELALAGVSDYQRALGELNKQYDEMLAQAGKDKNLRAQLIALRDREIQQLEEEKSKSTIENFQEFLGLVTPFDKVRKTSEDLIKQINDSPFGDARKGRMIARVLEEVNKQIEKMAKESALSLFGEMSADLERFGASQELQDQVRLQMALIEHTLKMEHYRTEIEILRAQGKLAPEVLKALDDAFKFLEGINPADFLTPSAPPGGGPPPGYEWNGYDWVPTGQGEPENPFTRAMELLNSYLEDDSDTFSAAIAKVHEDFAFIIDILGETPEVMSAYTDALERVREQFLGDLREFYDSLREGPDSSQTTAQQYASAESRFFELLNDDIDNMDQLDEIQDAGEIWRDLAAEMFGTSTGGFEDVISRLESALGPLLGIAPSGESSLFNLISGPAEWFQRSSDQTSEAIYDGTDRMVEATTDVAEVLDFRSARQESILERISNGIDNLSFNISEFPNSPAGASYGG